MVFIFKCHNEIKLEMFYSYLINFIIYELLFGEKQAHFFKSPFHLEKNMIYFAVLQIYFN